MIEPVDRNIEPNLPNGIQVVREPLGELLNGVHVKGKAEIFGQPFDGDEKIAGQGPLDGFFIQKIQLVSFKEDGLVGLCHIERGTLPVDLQRVAVSLEERCQDRGDRI